MPKKVILTESIINHPDFRGMTATQRWVFLTLLVYANPEGVVCCDPGWIKTRGFSDPGMMNTPRKHIEKGVSLLRERGVIMKLGVSDGEETGKRPASDWEVMGKSEGSDGEETGKRPVRGMEEPRLTYCKITNYHDNNRLRKRRKERNGTEGNGMEWINDPPPTVDQMPGIVNGRLSGHQEKVVQQLVTLFRMNLSDAVSTVRSLGTTMDDIGTWVELFEAEKQANPTLGNMAVFRADALAYRNPRDHPIHRKRLNASKPPGSDWESDEEIRREVQG